MYFTRISQMDMISRMAAKFQVLLDSLIDGNRRRAARKARAIKKARQDEDMKVIAWDIVEEMAQGQAVKNAVVNLPSVFPGIGTVISFWLIGAENFLMLDQSVLLVLMLAHLFDHPVLGDRDRLKQVILGILGKAYRIADDPVVVDTDFVARNYLMNTLPQKYLNKGIKKLFNRLFPPRKRWRLLPLGIGTVSSAIDGYETTIRVGRLAVEYLLSPYDEDR